MICCLIFLFVEVVAAIAVGLNPTANSTEHLPLLELPYGKWRAAQYDQEADVYTFRNIRYAAPPTGNLRWAKPAPPDYVSGIQDGSYGHNCIAATLPPPYDNDPVFRRLVKTGAEDCLFLDVYVPGKVIRIKKSWKLPVVFWIYGGGYLSGSKDQDLAHGLYSGTNLITRANGNVVVVTINYRLGAFGFLAGTTMEATALPNAGLHDQRAALQWVQDFIHHVGGDRDNVSAWGESAGAGSILHHLIAEGGSLDPLFHRAVVMSPGITPIIDRKGQVEEMFKDFTKAAGCESQGIECLRAANVSTLTDANEKVAIYNPMPDGRYIRRIPDVELSEGHFWKHLDSLIVSHVVDEGESNVPNPIDPDYIANFLKGLFPSYAPDAALTIEKLYKNTPGPPRTRAKIIFGDAIFHCHIRGMIEAYGSKAYLMQFSYPPGIHGTDVPAVFYDSLRNHSVPIFSAYQSYLTSHAQTGNPNILRDPVANPQTIKWPRVGDVNTEKIHSAINMTELGFEVIDDDKPRKSVCDVWKEVWLDVTRKGEENCYSV
ncbi:hypothetical protein LOZ61_002943 [Ophidiomyces ophidiicola]|nr:hypothetical protein LOZ61_002943 [Ophidiomyces ophidiicola]KAI1920735.1 hypothetical protein LOZ64_001783 [Ophidiomyces ophidiicola]KAI1928588.1 hypothetical protein LOZ60_002309 [Ophidiomyces ophidiicola]KAI1961220.1 hypothetical protein LOZ59_002469 [Ophidiomyces ophidiicola]KAI2008807.1 hypothetical protein LOZ49_004124 [Ophidiomyces ophidiicola]